MHSNPENLNVIFEDNHLLVVNKRAGDIVQGDRTGDTPLSEVAKAYIKKKYNKPGKVFLGVTHRIDRPTSGLVVFARTSKALARMNSIFSEKAAQKTYWAVVKSRPEPAEAELVHWMVRNQGQNKSYARTRQTENAKKAVMKYKTLGILDRYTLLEVDLLTGRHHQIRAQLAVIGSPIRGDLKYGFDRSNPDGSIHLHARRLTFIHPVSKQELQLVADPPPDPLWDACLSMISDQDPING